MFDVVHVRGVHHGDAVVLDDLQRRQHEHARCCRKRDRYERLRCLGRVHELSNVILRPKPEGSPGLRGFFVAARLQNDISYFQTTPWNPIPVHGVPVFLRRVAFGDLHDRARGLVHLSLRKFHAPAPPFVLPGPLGRFPDFVARIAALSFPGWLRLPLRFPVPADHAGDTRSPKFLGDPCARATSLTDPGATSAQDSRGLAPALRARRCCLPRSEPCRPRPRPNFGAYPRGPLTCCLRFAAALTVPTTQDSLPGGAPQPYRDGIFTRKVLAWRNRTLGRFARSVVRAQAPAPCAGGPCSTNSTHDVSRCIHTLWSRPRPAVSPSQ